MHLGTLLPVVVVYRRRLVAIARAVAGRGDEDGRRLVRALALATAPAALVGVLVRGSLEAAFAAPAVAAVGLVATAGLLLSLRATAQPGRATGTVPGPTVALLIGMAQACALLPGLSRSASTIVSARWLGLGPDDAAAFSFLLSVPVVLGAAMVEALGHGTARLAPAPALVAFAFAAASGYLALRLVQTVLRRGRLDLFAPYVLALALAIVWWL